MILRLIADRGQKHQKFSLKSFIQIGKLDYHFDNSKHLFFCTSEKSYHQIRFWFTVGISATFFIQFFFFCFIRIFHRHTLCAPPDMWHHKTRYIIGTSLNAGISSSSSSFAWRAKEREKTRFTISRYQLHNIVSNEQFKPISRCCCVVVCCWGIYFLSLLTFLGDCFCFIFVTIFHFIISI